MKTLALNDILSGESYETLLSREEWLEKRKCILERDAHRCQRCGATSHLQIHHRQYHKLTQGPMVKPWEYHDHYLVTLCQTCHQLGHQLFQIPCFTIK